MAVPLGFLYHARVVASADQDIPRAETRRGSPEGPTDGELVTRARGGESGAFDLLAERYYRMVSILAREKVGHRTDAEDVVQEAFLRAHRALESLRDPEKFGPWIYHITAKLCIDWQRRKGRREPLASLDEPAVHAQAATKEDDAPGASLEASEERGRVVVAIGALPDKYRLVITLRYVQRLSYKEIADHLGEPAGTIANRLHRATKMLKTALGLEAGTGLAGGAEEDEA